MSSHIKDESVITLLQTERDRCTQVIERVAKDIERLPRGSLGQRKVKAGGKVYVYPCLKYREGKHVKFEHVPPQKVDEIRLELERKKKLQDTLKANKKRIDTINHILRRA